MSSCDVTYTNSIHGCITCIGIQILQFQQGLFDLDTGELKDNQDIHIGHHVNEEEDM